MALTLGDFDHDDRRGDALVDLVCAVAAGRVTSNQIGRHLGRGDSDGGAPVYAQLPTYAARTERHDVHVPCGLPPPPRRLASLRLKHAKRGQRSPL